MNLIPQWLRSRTRTFCGIALEVKRITEYRPRVGTTAHASRAIDHFREEFTVGHEVVVYHRRKRKVVKAFIPQDTSNWDLVKKIQGGVNQRSYLEVRCQEEVWLFFVCERAISDILPTMSLA